ncbi:MAG TPA: sugar phosphate nucleotidyltransferase, partial [Gemmatimonadaceae bacterium]|nr:sugar phosphate nucleotidyltransferase [Gemmatimonadaceae bacterium]
TDVCLVIGPEHDHVRDHYGKRHPPRRIRVSFAIQEKALGTADAVLAAEQFAAGESFVVLNSDNYYPATALAALRAATPPAIVAFDRDTLVRAGNVEPERTTRFGALEIDDAGHLRRIVARRPAESTGTAGPVYSSMNCWLFTSDIFHACRAVPLSARGEYELPQAVQLAIDSGADFNAIKVSAPVLDLSSRGDIAGVAHRLKEVTVLL